MRSNPAAILDCKRHKRVLSPICRRYRVGRDLVRLELRVLSLLGRKSRDRRNSRQERIPVYNRDYPIKDEVPDWFHEVQHNQVAQTRGISKPEPPRFLYNGRLRNSRLLHDVPKGLDEAMMHKVARTPIWAARHVTLQCLKGARWKTTLGTMG